ncbi:MAG: RHS repeat-associated core domain-containing protein [Bacteroidia bacterium]
MKNLIALIAACLLIFSNPLSSVAQVVGGTADNQAAPKNAPVHHDKIDVSGGVDPFTGIYSTGFVLGNVKTPTGLSFSLTSGYNSVVVTGDNSPSVEGVPYGSGWNLNIPFVRVMYSSATKYSPQDRAQIESPASLQQQNNPGPTFNNEELSAEGEVYWHSPELNIPGVANGRLVYKYYDEEAGSFVFVLHKFEKYIEAHFSAANGWKVVLPNGDEYHFWEPVYNFTAPNNQRAEDNLLTEVNGTLNEKTIGRIYPKFLPGTWYVTKINNPHNHAKHEIQFTYKRYGAFNYYKQTHLTIDHFSLEQDIFLQGVAAVYADQNMVIPFEKIELTYQRDDALYNGHSNFMTTDTFSFDELYNCKNVFATGPYNNFAKRSIKTPTAPSYNDPRINFDYWKRFRSVKFFNQQAGSKDIVPTNPYLFSTPPTGNSLFKETLLSDPGNSSPKFLHSFFESPKIGAYSQQNMNTPHVEMHPGDIYEIRTHITAPQERYSDYATFDINIVSGDLSDNEPDIDGTPDVVLSENFNNENNSESYRTQHTSQIKEEDYNYRRDETIFTTFNNAVKWEFAGNTLNTSSFFTMPNLPENWHGIYLQIGPGNSDNDFSIDLCNPANSMTNNPNCSYSTFSYQSYHTYYSQSCYPSLFDKKLYLQNSKFTKIPMNFGIGMPWYNLSHNKIQNGLIPVNSKVYKSWWRSSSSCNNQYLDNNNRPTLTSDLMLSGVDIIRYGKKPFMLKEVKKYVYNQTATSNHKLEAQQVGSYTFKYDVIEVETYDNIAGCNLPSTSRTALPDEYKRMVVVLKEIRQNNAANAQNNALVKFEYSTWDHNNHTPVHVSGLIYTYQQNGTGVIMTAFENTMGLRTEIEYEKTGLSPKPSKVMNIDYTPVNYRLIDVNNSCFFNGNNNLPKTYKGPVELTKFIFSVQKLTQKDPGGVAKDLVTQYSYTGTYASVYNVYLPQTITLDKNRSGLNNNINRNFIHHKGAALNSGYQYTTISKPSVSGSGNVTEKYEHYVETPNSNNATVSNLFGKIKKLEVFDESNNKVSEKRFQYKVIEAYENGAFRLNRPYSLNPQTQLMHRKSDYEDYIDPTCSSYTNLNRATLCAHNQSYTPATSPILSNDNSLRYWTIGKMRIRMSDSYYANANKADPLDILLAPELFDNDDNQKLYLSSLFIALTKTEEDMIDPVTQKTVTTVTEFSYYDADKKGNTTCEGFRYILDVPPGIDLKLYYEPSWELYSTKKYSLQGGTAFSMNEQFYYFDMVNRYNPFKLEEDGVIVNSLRGVPDYCENGIEGLLFSRVARNRMLPMETRVTSGKDVTENDNTLHRQSTYYLYGKVPLEECSRVNPFWQINDIKTLLSPPPGGGGGGGGGSTPCSTCTARNDINSLILMPGKPAFYKPGVPFNKKKFEQSMGEAFGETTMQRGLFLRKSLEYIKSHVEELSTEPGVFMPLSDYLEQIDLTDIVGRVAPVNSSDELNFQAYVFLSSGLRAVSSFLNSQNTTVPLEAPYTVPSTSITLFTIVNDSLHFTADSLEKIMDEYGDFYPDAIEPRERIGTEYTSLYKDNYAIRLNRVHVQVDEVIKPEMFEKFEIAPNANPAPIAANTYFAKSPILHFNIFTGTYDSQPNIKIGFEEVFPFEEIKLKHITSWDKFGREKTSTDVNGLQTQTESENYQITRYFDHHPINLPQVVKDYLEYKRFDIVNLKNLLQPLATQTGNAAPYFRTEYTYYDNLDLKTSKDVNNNSLSEFEYDAFHRINKTKLNGEVISTATYNNWNITDAANSGITYQQRQQRNYVQTHTYLTPNQSSALITREYTDLFGKSLYTASQTQTGATTYGSDVFQSGYVHYDLWGRAVRSYKPTVITGASTSSLSLGLPADFQNATEPTSADKIEHLYENTPASRVLKQADFGENITTSTHTSQFEYTVIDKNALVTELGLSTAERDELMPAFASATYYFLRQKNTDQDGKQYFTYANVLGQKVAEKAFVTQNTTPVVTLFYYNHQGKISKVINPEKQATTYKYNLMGWLTEKISVDAGRVRYMYNKAGQVVLEQDANAFAGNGTPAQMYYRAYTYDIYGRQTHQYRINHSTSCLNFSHLPDADRDKMLPFVFQDFNISLLYNNPATSADELYECTNTFSSNDSYNWTGHTVKKTEYVDPNNPFITYHTVVPFDFLNTTTTVSEKAAIYDSYTFNTASPAWDHSQATGTALQKLSGRVAKTISYNNNGLPVEYKFYSYLNDGKLDFELTQFYSKGIAGTAAITRGNVYKVNYTYNLQGLVTGKTLWVQLAGNGNYLNHSNTLAQLKHFIYEYDPLSRLSVVKVKRNTADTYAKVLAEYTYDKASGKLTGESHKAYQNENDALCNPQVYNVNYGYDNRDRLTYKHGDYFDWDLYYDGNQPASNLLPYNSMPGNVSNNYSGNINATVGKYKTNSTTLFHNPTQQYTFDNVTACAYTYDHLNRLTGVDATVGDHMDYLTAQHSPGTPPAGDVTNAALLADETFTYDKIGNTSQLTRNTYALPGSTVPAPVNWTYHYATGNNRLSNLNSPAVRSFSYDPNGNLLSDITSSTAQRDLLDFVYGRDNLIFYIRDNGNSIHNNEYLYNYKNQRVYKQYLLNFETPNGLYQYTLIDESGQALLLVKLVLDNTDNLGAVTAQTLDELYLNGTELIAREKYTNSTEALLPVRTYFVYDHLGNTRVTYTPQIGENCTLSKCSLENVLDYYAYGKLLRFYMKDQPERYQSTHHERDQQTGYDYRWARFSDPDIGRFLSVDPMAHGRPEMTPYHFVSNNPINRIDPDGRWDDWVQGADGNVRWDKDANSQATTKAKETYLGKTLTFNFTSYIDEKLWDGPLLNIPTGDKLISKITLTGNENSSGELTSITGRMWTKPGITPVGTARDYYPGEGGSNNVFSLKGTSKGISMNFEQHGSVSPIEEFGLNIMGYKIVDVAQRLNINYTSSTGALSIASYTNVFPSASIKMNGMSIMQYNQPSFKATHTAPIKGWTSPSPYKDNLGPRPIMDFSYYPSVFYKR